MATSGSYDFSVTAAQVIAASYEDLGVIAPGGTVSTALSTMALNRLNLIAKQHQGHADMTGGLKIFSRQRIHLFLQKGQQTYLVGPAATDDHSTTQYGRTTLGAAATASATTLTIASNTDTTTFPPNTVTMTNADIIGIQLDGGTIQWTTISGTPSTTATIASGLTGAAASGNYVWWFTSRSQRFVHLESAVLRDVNFNDTEFGVYRTVGDYERRVSAKYADGTPTSILVEPLKLNTRITCDIQPTKVTDTIVFTALYPSEDYDSSSNDIAYPQEYFLPLKWELMYQLPSFGKVWTQEMKDARAASWASVNQLNPENSTDYFQSAT